MLIDRPQVTETSTIINATVASGTVNPTDPDQGELFYRTDLQQLIVYNGTSWVEAGSSGLASHAGDGALHLTPAQNTLLDGLASTLTATELNYMDGVTSSVQTQLDSKLNRNGSNAATGDLNIGGFKLTNVGTPTANTDATNLQYVEQQISASVPVGVRGQVPFIATDNTRTSVQSFTASTGQFVESDAELALAQTRIISNETVFNEWYRFSHTTGLGGTLTRTGGVSRFQFASGNTATISANWPVGSTITLTSTNTTFNGTFTVTSTSVSGFAHVVFFQQPGQPDVGTAVNGTVQLGTLQPAIPTELVAWSYNSGTDTIEATVNSDSHIGFVSDRRYSSYVLEAQLSSTNDDDDTLGVLIAWAVDGAGREHTLTALRSPGGNGFTWRVVYNYLRSDAQTIYEGTSFVKWGNGAYGANAGAAGYVYAAGVNGWSVFPAGTRVKVTRNGDVFTLETTDLGQTTYIGGSAVATINLTSLPILAKFRGPSSYGFTASSQNAGSFDTLSFTDSQNAIYDIRNGSKYEYVGGTWVLQSGETLLGDIGPGRFLFDRYTEKLYYTDPNLGTIKLVTNVGEDLVPQVQDLRDDFSAHVIDNGLHLTPAQNTLLDGLASTLTATELNYMDGVTSSVQNQIDARLRLNGGDTMSGNLQMGNNRITGLGAPVAANDAATKDYVDTFVQGLAWKQSVRVATTTNIVLSGLQTINGVTVAVNDRVLVKNQTNLAENGIYLASSSAWSRAPDANTPEELDGAAVFVRSGTADADSAWIQTNAIVTVGTSAVNWSRFAASGGLTEGAGINIAGSVASVDAGQGLTFSGETLVTNINTATDFTYSSGQINLYTMPGLTPATYGSSSAIPQITIDAKGRITSVTTVAPAYQGADNTLTAIAAISDGAFGLIARTNDTASGATVRSIIINATGITSSNTNGVSGNPTFNLNDTSSNTANRIVSRDASGNFAASTITASLTGAASDNVLKVGDLMTGNLRFNANGIGISWDSLANFYVRADIGTGNPGINFSANDYIDYNRSTDVMRFSAVSERLTINTSAIQTPGGFYLSHAAPSSSNAWFSTPAYGVAQGDNRTHFGYNSGGTVGNYIRGAFTNIDGPVSIGSTLSAAGISSSADISISDSNPVLILRDLDSIGAAQVGYISLRDGTATETGYVGFGSGSNTDLTVSNNIGNVVLRVGGSDRIRVDSDATMTFLGTTNTSTLDPDVTSYGSFAVGGSVNGYQGFQFIETANVATFMVRNTDNLAGVYLVGNSTWQWYYDPTVSNIRIYDGAAARAVWHAGNLDPEVTPVANTVLLRDANGYAYGNYFNQSSGNSEVGATGISQVIVTNGTDNFFRKSSIAALAEAVADQNNIADGIWQFRSTGTVGANTSPPLQAYATGTNAAWMSFHRSGSYAVNMGLDSDNVFRLGGWSDGTNTYRLQVSTTNLTVPGSITLSNDVIFTGTTSVMRNSGETGYAAVSGGAAVNSGANIVLYGTAASPATTGRLRASGTTVLQWVSGQVNVTGDFIASGNVTAFSDARLKTDVRTIDDALSKVDAISGVTFTRTDTGERGTGVIAQDVQKVLPEAVRPDGEFLTVAYGNMVGLLIEAIKELKAEVEELKSKLAAEK